MKKVLLLPLLCALIVCFFGCNREKKPQGMPKLFPCTITLTFGTSPAEGVAIDLRPTEGNDKWPSSGLTDASGKAKIVTYGKFPGIPAGKYKILLSKREEEGGTPADETKSVKTTKPLKIYSLVEKQFTQAETTPLELTVTDHAMDETFDLGKPVRVLVETINPGGP